MGDQTNFVHPTREDREAYAKLRRIAVEHLQDHPHIERTHRLMQLPQVLGDA